MPNIKPLSDLRNYTEVLNEVSYGNCVYLTKNGRGCAAIVDMRELDEQRAVKELYAAVAKGEASALEKGWVSVAQAEAALGV